MLPLDRDLVDPSLLETDHGRWHAYSSIVELKCDTKLVHSVNRHPQTVQNVVEDDDPPFLLFVLGESILCVYQSHLLQYRRLSTLSGTCYIPQLEIGPIVRLRTRMGGSGIPKSKSFTTFCITFSSRWIRASISRLLFASPSSRPPKHILNNCAVAEEWCEVRSICAATATSDEFWLGIFLQVLRTSEG